MVFNKLISFTVVFVVFIGKCDCQDHTPLHLTVYYESKCPDSKSFILSQLKPATQLLGNHVMLKLVPFGKSKSIMNGLSGFECQHGPSECLGNLVQDCTLDLMQHRPDLEKVDYVVCEMASGAGANGSLECVQKTDVPPELVQQCLSSGRGTQLQIQSEILTKMVDPKFIPTITINSVFDQMIQNYSLVDLTGVLCSMINTSVPCSRYYNGLALNQVLLPNVNEYTTIQVYQRFLFNLQSYFWWTKR